MSTQRTTATPPVHGSISPHPARRGFPMAMEAVMIAASDGHDLTQRDAMPTISAFFGIYIRMYLRDHPPPHFHAD